MLPAIFSETAATADFVECHCRLLGQQYEPPAALASPAGEFIYTDVGFSQGSQVAPALNNVGSMVGYAYNADFSETRAVYWASSSSPAVILSTTGEFSNGTAEGISDGGQIVGTVYNSDFSGIACLYLAEVQQPGHRSEHGDPT